MPFTSAIQKFGCDPGLHRPRPNGIAPRPCSIEHGRRCENQRTTGLIAVMQSTRIRLLNPAAFKFSGPTLRRVGTRQDLPPAIGMRGTYSDRPGASRKM
ncbi:hypothetical protein SL003B_1733 [Polymorphum gilvum SL003B-26A1]|uniref:Uncharacterized protein n=1 Tax=Polymorphum gilvum (strain LMG 25793 / CGMCC 1.9160 / SL003B-26A1) TaxID=991905 RepID=F2J5S7_POLGS|nr:hypothetical protein SL003B_1733 [Polymorphum gilvum SL003B-26A1]